MPDEYNYIVLNELGVLEEINKIDITCITDESYEEDLSKILNRLQRE